MSKPRQKSQLYLIVPSDADDGLLSALSNALQMHQVACVLLAAGSGGHVSGDLAQKVQECCEREDTAFLIENDWQLAKSIAADGVHIHADEESYRDARNELGEDAIIGVACPPERHASLVLAELGADYVAFESTTGEDGDAALTEMLEWWAEVVEVPVVAFSADTLEQIEHFAEAGADFVAVGELIWSHPEGPAACLAEIGKLLESNRAAA